MCFTIDQIEQACGLLLLTRLNTFVYYCKRCPRKFETGSHLEVHILSEHQNDKEDVIVNENVFVDEFEATPVEDEYESSNIKIEQFEINTEVLDEPNILEEKVDEFKPLTVLLVNENIDNDNNCIETNKVKDEMTFNETTEEHLEEYVEPESNNMEMTYEEADVDPISTHRRRKKHKCQHCDKSFTYPSILQDHIYAIHTKERPYNCNYCDKDFKTKRAVKIHELTHSEAKLKCRYCESMFTQPASRYKHENIFHKKVVMPDDGQRVDKVKPLILVNDNLEVDPIEISPNLRNIETNIRKKNGCEICNKIPKRGMEYHMKRFHSDHPFKCDLCDASFTKRGSRVNHMRIHTGEKPFLCSTCGKAFNTNSGCYIHETQVHNSVKKHQCPHCDKSFHVRSRLRDHINAIHTKERSFFCDICGKNFTTNRAVALHKLTHSEAKLKCRYCESIFTQPASRYKHEKNLHKKNILVGDRKKKRSRE